MKATIILTSLLLLAGMTGTAPALVYDAAGDFSTATNPNGVWTYGVQDALGNFAADDSTIAVPATTTWSGPVSGGTATVSAHYSSTYGSYSEQGSAPGLNIVGGNTTGYDLYVDDVDSYNTTYPNRTLLRPGALILRTGNGPAYVPNSGDLRFTAPRNGEYTVNAQMFCAFVPRSDYHNQSEVCTVKVGGVTDQSQGITGYYYDNPYDTVTRTTFTYSKTLSLTAGTNVDFLVTAGPPVAQAVGAFITITPTPEPGTLVLLVTGLLGLLAYAWRKRK